MVEREVTTPVVVLEVPGDGVESRRPGRRHRVSCAVGGSGRAPRRAAPWVRLPWVVVSGFEGSLALHPIPGREPADPGLGQAVGACCFGRGQALRGDGGDDQPGSRPHRRFAGPEVLPMSRDMCCSCPEPAHCPRCNCDVSGNTRTYECRSGCCEPPWVRRRVCGLRDLPVGGCGSSLPVMLFELNRGQVPDRGVEPARCCTSGPSGRPAIRRRDGRSRPARPG